MDKVYYANAVYGKEEVAAVNKVLKNHLTLMDGPLVKKFEEQEARNFVTTRSENFDVVCEMAGLSPDYVWDKINQFRNNKERVKHVFEMVG